MCCASVERHLESFHYSVSIFFHYIRQNSQGQIAVLANKTTGVLQHLKLHVVVESTLSSAMKCAISNAGSLLPGYVCENQDRLGDSLVQLTDTSTQNIMTKIVASNETHEMLPCMSSSVNPTL